MGMSTYVVGIKPANDRWSQMKEIWDVCDKADVNVPKQVIDFFDQCVPDEKGVLIELGGHECLCEWGNEHQSGFEVDIRKIPEDIKIIRFINSW